MITLDVDGTMTALRDAGVALADGYSFVKRISPVLSEVDGKAKFEKLLIETRQLSYDLGRARGRLEKLSSDWAEFYRSMKYADVWRIERGREFASGVARLFSLANRVEGYWRDHLNMVFSWHQDVSEEVHSYNVSREEYHVVCSFVSQLELLGREVSMFGDVIRRILGEVDFDDE